MLANSLDLASYRLFEPLAEGGVASIYLARSGDGEIRAVKLIDRTLIDQPTIIQRFHREARVASLLMHPNIARIYDAGETDGFLYIAMELVRGQTLEEIATRVPPGGWPVGLIMRIGLDVLSALHYTHELEDEQGRHLSVVHRDLTPKNIMLGYDGVAKLLDYGVAYAQDGDFETLLGRINGTPAYMSPEQAMGNPVDRRSDLYSIAVVLYELLVGQRMVSEGPLQAQLIEIVKGAPPATLSTLNPALPRALDPIFARALSKSPDDRFESALEFANALRTAIIELSPWTNERCGSLALRLFGQEKASLEAKISALQRSASPAGTAEAPVKPQEEPLLEKPSVDKSWDHYVELPASLRGPPTQKTVSEVASADSPRPSFGLGFVAGLVCGIVGTIAVLQLL